MLTIILLLLALVTVLVWPLVFKKRQTGGQAGGDQSLISLQKDNEHLREKQKDQEVNLAVLKERLGKLEQENSRLNRENILFKNTDDDRRTEYEKKVGALNSIKEKIEDDRRKETEGQHEKEIRRLNSLKETWAKHQERVKEAIKAICQKHTIDYVDKVPFRGNPDNTIKICDEFVIFDAKSPASDDLDNFPSYIRLQTESVKKYIKEENVWKDIFLVIPSNTLGVIDQFSFNMADYSVYVVTLDALEPIILTLKKLEEYEFVEQLSPEERDNICRVIGKFAHITKRRVQIDLYFAREFLGALLKSESYLPSDMLEKAIEYERSEKLNPPQEKRVKSISSKELEADSQKIKTEAEAKGISFPASIQENIKSLPLYTDDKPDNKLIENTKGKKKKW